MNAAVNSAETAYYRRELGIFLTETPPTDAPKHPFRPLSPRNPFFPASGPATGSFNGLHAKSNIPIGSTSRLSKDDGHANKRHRQAPAQPV